MGASFCIWYQGGTRVHGALLRSDRRWTMNHRVAAKIVLVLLVLLAIVSLGPLLWML